MINIDLSKLDIAITYIQRMADGLDPVKNIQVEENSVINNPNVIRCMYFIQDVLMEVRKNDGVIGSKKRTGKEPFPFEVLDNYIYEKDKSISHIISQIKELVANPNVKVMGYKVLSDWLKASGYLLEEVDKYTGKKTNIPTDKGKELGIYLEERTSMRGENYNVVMYDQKAQEFLVHNLEAIVNGEIVTEEGCESNHM